MINSWDEIDIGCMKRVSLKHNLFWAKDYNGDLAFIISLDNISYPDFPLIKISGMKIILKNEENNAKIYLVLKDIKDIDIFDQICKDIMSVVELDNYKISATTVINRLKQWQNFLSIHREKSFSIEKQIGLFGELAFIYHKLFPLLGVKNSILSWVGPNKDKQDFRFKKINVEIKSYLDNKRGIVNISSIEQLNPNNGKLYLFTYGLKHDDSGITIKEFIKTIQKKILEESNSDLHYFNTLIEEYGYFEGYNYENLLKLSILEENMFNVDNEFPKLPMDIKREEIKSIQYTIDTNLCSKHLISISELSKIKEED